MLGKIPFGLRVFEEAAADLTAALAAARGQSRKLIVVDLDNTLWGGIVGDDGWENLELGRTSAKGEAYVEFQRSLLALKRRGIILGICSKNEEEVALEAIDKHPEMILRRDDFAGWQINWNDKAANLKALVEELNLGLQSVVFLDDEPIEQTRVVESWPEVLVPDWPKDPATYATKLRSLRCFDMVHLTLEDHLRSEQYLAERHRRSSQQTAASMNDWLAKLDLQVKASKLDSISLQRAAQLLNKTNQFNLTTRRMSEAELDGWSQKASHHVYVFRVQDRFGDYGLTALASLSISGTTAEIIDFLMSCRVMGRAVESAALHYLSTQASNLKCTWLQGKHIPTAKNKPCQKVLPDAGFVPRDQRWQFDLRQTIALPEHITLTYS